MVLLSRSTIALALVLVWTAELMRLLMESPEQPPAWGRVCQGLVCRKAEIPCRPGSVSELSVTTPMEKQDYSCGSDEILGTVSFVTPSSV